MAPMATLGILGGISWESTSLMYQHINRDVRERLGGFHSAPLIINSVDFDEFEDLLQRCAWEEAAERLGEAAKGLVAAGAEAVMLCCNTYHHVADEIAKAAGVPFIHIVDACAKKIRERKLQRVILLGSKWTMEGDYFTKRLQENGLTPIVPDEAGRNAIHNVLLDELVHGKVLPESRNSYLRVIDDLVRSHGAQGVIAGCTEIGMLINEDDVGMPVFDTCKIHAEGAVDWAIAHGRGVTSEKKHTHGEDAALAREDAPDREIAYSSIVEVAKL